MRFLDSRDMREKAGGAREQPLMNTDEQGQEERTSYRRFGPMERFARWLGEQGDNSVLPMYTIENLESRVSLRVLVLKNLATDEYRWIRIRESKEKENAAIRPQPKGGAAKRQPKERRIGHG